MLSRRFLLSILPCPTFVAIRMIIVPTLKEVVYERMVGLRNESNIAIFSLNHLTLSLKAGRGRRKVSEILLKDDRWV